MTSPHMNSANTFRVSELLGPQWVFLVYQEALRCLIQYPLCLKPGVSSGYCMRSPSSHALLAESEEETLESKNSAAQYPLAKKKKKSTVLDKQRRKFNI